MCGKPYKNGSDSFWGYCPPCGYVEMFYEPLPAQAKFHASEKKYRLYAGGFGSGKTLAGCMEAIKLAMRYPGNFGLIGAQTYPALRDTTRKDFLNVVPEPFLKGGKLEKAFNNSENSIEFNNGSVIIFRSMDEPNKYKSLNLGFFYIDELTEVSEKVWNMLESRLRRTTIPKRTGFASTNPEGGSWVYRKFVLERKKDYDYFEAATTENVHLPADYVESMLESYSEEWIQRYIYAKWNVFEGRIYSQFVPEFPYVIPHQKPDPTHPIYVGIDSGLHNPTAALWASVNPRNGDIYVFQEYYQKGALIEDHANKIKFMSRNLPIYAYFIDPETQKRNAVTGQSVRGEYIKNGIPVRLANNDVLAGIHKVASKFKQRPDGTPKLVISERCTNLIEELSQYRWEENTQVKTNKNEPEKPHKYKDHAPDALRYLVMGIPEAHNNSPEALEDYRPTPLYGEDEDHVEIYSGMV